MYELVVRHFLACVSQPAIGAGTTVEIDIAGEQFSASGRVIIAVSFRPLKFIFYFIFNMICDGWITCCLYLLHHLNSQPYFQRANHSFIDPTPVFQKEKNELNFKFKICKPNILFSK